MDHPVTCPECGERMRIQVAVAVVWKICDRCGVFQIEPVEVH
jgi:ribosomal protein L37AE/L43A